MAASPKDETLMSLRAPQPLLPFLLLLATACGTTANEEGTETSDEEGLGTLSEALTFTETGGLVSMEAVSFVTRMFAPS